MWAECVFSVVVREEARLVINITEPFDPKNLESIIRAARLSAELAQPEVAGNPELMKVSDIELYIPEVLTIFPDDEDGGPAVDFPQSAKLAKPE